MNPSPFIVQLRDPEGRFSGPFRFRYVNGRDWAVAEDLSYRTRAGPVSTVRAGFTTDFATIPPPLWPFMPPAGDGRNFYGLAALWHDWLYWHGAVEGRPISRPYADGIFLELMRYLGVSRLLARIMWAAVRSFGWYQWNKYRRHNENRIYPSGRPVAL
ncbi:MAG: DUF1353 domain-containing protein [Kiritimatiellae bacterium]|nr:DUF1353 domain-containing protein [Kiritimatiellia bacterium]